MVRGAGLALRMTVVAALVAGMAIGAVAMGKVQSSRVYELRIYKTAEGRLGALLARFGGGEVELFHKHGMTSVGYWVPDEAPASQNTLVYMLAHASRESAAASWQAFRDDPEWQTMRSESLVDGPIVTNVESTFLNPADFSPLQ
jgi:hypothetical protein